MVLLVAAPNKHTKSIHGREGTDATGCSLESKPRGVVPTHEGSRCTPRPLPGMRIEAVLPGGDVEPTDPKDPRRLNSSTPGPGGVANEASERELGESGRPSGVTRAAEPG